MDSLEKRVILNDAINVVTRTRVRPDTSSKPGLWSSCRRHGQIYVTWTQIASAMRECSPSYEHGWAFSEEARRDPTSCWTHRPRITQMRRSTPSLPAFASLTALPAYGA
jgi:hypothetical protein